MDGNKCDNFALTCSLSGHDLEIRSLVSLSQPDGAFVSVCTNRIVVWTPEKNGSGFSGDSVIHSPSNAIHTLCVIAPNDEHPSGLILVGTDEPSVKAYDHVSTSDRPIYTLNEHTDIVCSLVAGRFGTVVSGSWDKTAKVWYKQKCTMTLTGHEGAILSILLMPVGGYMLTGSADSSIKRWRAGKCEQTFEGHSDWVRALCVLTQSEFLSSSNDGTIRRWNISDGCLQTFSGHTGRVLCLACLPGGRGFVSVGEDGRMSVWKDGKQVQVVKSDDQQKLSSVCVLSNGDIVTGASDNLIRVFTANPECFAAGLSPEIPEYIATAEGHQRSERKKLPGEYFPESTYITFESLNKKGVLSKLREFNYETSAESQLNKAEMGHLELLASGLKGEAPEGVFDALWKLLSWPNPDLLFPALDLLRFSLLNKSINSHLCTSKEGQRFIDYISSILSTSSPSPRNQHLILRAVCNSFQHAPGERLMLSNFDRLASDFLQLESDSEPHLQIAQCSLLLNFVIAFSRGSDSSAKMRCLSGAVALSQSLTDSEAYFRLLVAIGTGVVDDRACQKLARTLDLQNFFNMCRCDDSEKVRTTAESITKRIT